MGSRRQTEAELDAYERRLGVGGGVYASSHTARADPWWIVVWVSEFFLYPHVDRVQAPDAALARIRVERDRRKLRGLVVTSVAREEWRRL